MVKKTFPLLIAALLLLSGCAHVKAPVSSGYFFQALGEDGELVVTADMDKVREGEFSSFLPKDGNIVLDRSERVTVSLLPKDETIYPSTMDNFVLSGALEGNFPKDLTNLGLSWNKDFQVVKDEGPKRYINGNHLQVASPANGMVLFSNGDYQAFFEKTYEKRQKLIADEVAAMMAAAEVAFYSRSPKTLMDLGFQLPVVVLQSIQETYLMASSNEEGVCLNGLLEMDSEADARVVTTLLKNQYVQVIRKNGEKLDVQKAAGYFTYEGSSVHISSYILSNNMKEKMGQMLTSNLGGII